MQAWGPLCTQLGEGPLWCERERCLFLTDIEARTLHRVAADGSSEAHPLPDRLGSFALCEAPGLLLLGLARSVVLYDTRSRRLGVPAPLPLGLRQRVNDGRCDPQGRFVFGTYVESADAMDVGGWWRLDGHLRAEPLPLPPPRVANALAFSPDGQRMTWTDSPSRRIHVTDYRADGRIGPSRVLATLDEGTPGMPDGAAFDRDGGLWIALFGGGALLRLDAGGGVTDRVPLPVSRPTCPVFTGDRFDRLAVSSAHIGLDDTARQREPLAGALLVAPVGRVGLPAHRFATDRRP